MSKVQFTKAQERAINLHGKDILVYASAGSGKTTVLIQRIITSILNGMSLDSMLIVTFTRAAANEMRDRLRVALTNELSKTNLSFSDEEFLRSQIINLSNADIETIDSFCQKVIRAHFNVVGIDPGFRILTDQSEVEKLKAEPFDDTFGEFLEQKGEDFFNLVKNFTDGKTIQQFQDLVHDLEAYSSSLADQDQWLNSIDHLYTFDGSFSSGTFYQKELKPFVKKRIKTFIRKFKQILDISSSYPELEFYFTEAENGISYFSQVIDRLSELDYEELKSQLFDFSFARAKVVRSSDEGVMEAKKIVQKLRDGLKKSLVDPKNGLAKLFQYSEAEITDLSKLTADRIKLLADFTRSYLKKVELVKRRENSYEFSDLERFAAQILQNSETARIDYQNHFKEILVDEYQDINDLQDSILTMLSGNQHNLFMVGDIKQSIYGFRHANPQLFLQKYQEFQSEKSLDQEVIVIAENYRSVENIDSTVNFFFEQLMDQEVGELDYDENSHLKFGAKYYPAEIDDQVELLIDQNSSDDISQAEQMARIVAERIQKMLKDHHKIYDSNTKKLRDITLGDIAILTRTKAENRVIMNTFEAAGINITSGQNEDFYLNSEIKIITSFFENY